MNDRYLYRAKRTDNGEWVEGSYVYTFTEDKDCPCSGIYKENHWIAEENGNMVSIDPSTICQCTGLKDKNGKLIWENDITKLVLEDGEVRYFEVSFKKVVRKVLCHSDFDDAVAKVELNAICFEWNGYELFPCIDDKGISDVSKMEIVGNIFDNQELLEVGE